MESTIGLGISKVLSHNLNMSNFTLELKGNLFNRYRFKIILTELQKASNLLHLHLDLGGTLMGGQQLDLLANFIKDHKRIICLDLKARYNEIDDDQINGFIETIQSNRSLKQLKLQAAFCDMTDKGVKSLLQFML